MDNTKLMDIIAYYLSEYDMEAVNFLGYSSRSEAFQSIGLLFNKNNNYLKRLRDEYDVITSSTRRGQCNRPPRERITSTKHHLESFSFEELSQIVYAILENANGDSAPVDSMEPIVACNVQDVSKEELEHIINFKDTSSGIKITNGKTYKRVFNTSIIKQLKRLYKGNCQVCGCNPLKGFDANICEVHHINFFAASQNNDSSNLIVLCPNHHRLIHKLNPQFDPLRRAFILANGDELKIKIDYHLFD